MTWHSDSTTPQAKHLRSCIGRFSYLTVSILIGATPHLNLGKTLPCALGMSSKTLISVSNVSLKDLYERSLFWLPFGRCVLSRSDLQLDLNTANSLSWIFIV